MIENTKIIPQEKIPVILCTIELHTDFDYSVEVASEIPNSVTKIQIFSKYVKATITNGDNGLDFNIDYIIPLTDYSNLVTYIKELQFYYKMAKFKS